MKPQVVLVLQTVLFVSSQEQWRPTQGSATNAYIRGGRGMRWHELERLAKVTRDTDSRIVDWTRDGRNEDTNELDAKSPAYNFYPSRRETRKKKKPAVSLNVDFRQQTGTENSKEQLSHMEMVVICFSRWLSCDRCQTGQT